ncbi:hypothetical protein QVD17_35189 [Tagetes erecta]|uniref:Uncharacterized protein n=1 Tax=Tagetes erecta TaxID=13708 RepID=A0AAD8NM57_TARER|nr:hypothetical protein QVD17_35189 [Tagetes erecta]
MVCICLLHKSTKILILSHWRRSVMLTLIPYPTRPDPTVCCSVFKDHKICRHDSIDASQNLLITATLWFANILPQLFRAYYLLL